MSECVFIYLWGPKIASLQYLWEPKSRSPQEQLGGVCDHKARLTREANYPHRPAVTGCYCRVLVQTKRSLSHALLVKGAFDLNWRKNRPLYKNEQVVITSDDPYVKVGSLWQRRGWALFTCILKLQTCMCSRTTASRGLSRRSTGTLKVQKCTVTWSCRKDHPYLSQCLFFSFVGGDHELSNRTWYKGTRWILQFKVFFAPNRWWSVKPVCGSCTSNIKRGKWKYKDRRNVLRTEEINSNYYKSFPL